MKLKCATCGYPMTRGEDVSNDGECDWCVNKRNEDVLQSKNKKTRIAQLIAANRGY